MRRRGLLAAGMLSTALLVAAPVPAQTPVPPQPVQAQQPAISAPAPEESAAPAEAAPPAFRPGFLDALGRWFGDPRAVIDSQVKSTQDTVGTTLGTIGTQARDAAGAVVAVPGTRVVTGRQLCPAAVNGAPDCQQGVEALCKSKGFQGGRTIDVTSSQRCPAKVWIAGRAPKEGECRMETYVTRAVCQ